MLSPRRPHSSHGAVKMRIWVALVLTVGFLSVVWGTSNKPSVPATASKSGNERTYRKLHSPKGSVNQKSQFMSLSDNCNVQSLSLYDITLRSIDTTSNVAQFNQSFDQYMLDVLRKWDSMSDNCVSCQGSERPQYKSDICGYHSSGLLFNLLPTKCNFICKYGEPFPKMPKPGPDPESSELVFYVFLSVSGVALLVVGVLAGYAWGKRSASVTPRKLEARFPTYHRVVDMKSR